MSKMILMADDIPFDLYTLEKYGLDGSESAVPNLAFEFKKLGHDVYVYGVTKIESHIHKGGGLYFMITIQSVMLL